LRGKRRRLTTRTPIAPSSPRTAAPYHLPDVPVDEAHRRHRDTLGELAARNGTGLLRFSREQFRAVVVYDQRLFNRWRYRHGGFDREPPTPDFQTLLASPVPVAHGEGVLP